MRCFSLVNAAKAEFPANAKTTFPAHENNDC